MSDSFPVCLIQGIGHLDANVYDFGRRERAAADLGGEGLPLRE
jgi:hypothetical protein